MRNEFNSDGSLTPTGAKVQKQIAAQIRRSDRRDVRLCERHAKHEQRVVNCKYCLGAK